MPAQTIFVGSLPASASNERLEEIFSEIGPIKQCFVVREKGTEKCRGFGYVTYSMEEDAQRALKDIKDYDGKALSLSVAKKKVKDKKPSATKEPPSSPEKREEQPKGLKKKQLKARLIIRNLSFKCSEDDLKEVFAKFGTVVESKIPLKPDGKMRGFAFVMFKNMSQAAKALNEMNLKEIKGRQVAVDWAVPKDKFIATQQSTVAEHQNVEVETIKQSDTESDTEDANDQKTQAAPAEKRVTSKATVQMEESQSDDSEEDEDYEDDSEEEKDDGEEDDEVDSEEEDNDDSEEEGSLDSNYEDDSQDDEENEDNKSKSVARKKTSKKLLPSDVTEGRTVFIRNLSFDTEEDGLEEVLLQYGELNYIKIVVNTDTEHSKGCAFAQFRTKEAAERCIAASQDEAENGGIRVDGRKLLIVAAVSREDASKMKVNKVKVETGARNLYLAREGLIRAGTKAAEDVSEADMAKRVRFEEMKRAKLRNINVFVSKTRLCIHNLPKSVDNKKLRSLCLQAVKTAKGVRVTECRVMYDKKPLKGQVMGQSLGFGFVQLQEHEHALAVLRYLNNNPNIFTSHKRPIVEFSLEDLRKLKIKEMRQQKNKALNNQLLKGEAKSQSQSSEKSTLKQRAPQSHKKDDHYSGFQTKPEVEHVDLENGKKRKKVLPLPSHRGPKIRMRDKGKQQAPPPKKAKPGSKRREHPKQKMEKPTQPRSQNVKAAKKNFKSRDGDRFDCLVEQYKKKLMGNSTSVRRSKWFDS